MPDQHDDDLDMRIRELLGRAVDDSPPPPELDVHTIATNLNEPGTARRWLIGGASGLSIAAAIVAIFLFSRPDEVAEPLTPATEPAVLDTAGETRNTLAPIPPTTATVETTRAITPTTASATTATTSPPSTTETTSVATDSTSPPSTSATPADVSLARVAVGAGPDGVTVTGPDGVPRTITEEPMAVAAISRDGRTFMQRSEDLRDPSADTTILMHDPGTGAITPLQPVGDVVGPLRLHDVVDIEGATTLLVESGPANCGGFENCDGVLWAVRPDDSTATELDRMSVWESGWSRLNVADTGVAVGTISAEAATGLYSVSLTQEAVIAPAAVGLEELYFDCSNCPANYSIEPSGRYVVWTVFDLTTFQHTLRIVAVDGSVERSIPLIDSDGSPCCGNDFGAVFPILPSLSVSDLSIDSEAAHGLVAVNETATDGLPPVSIDIATGVATEVRQGLTTTFGPLQVTDTDS